MFDNISNIPHRQYLLNPSFYLNYKYYQLSRKHENLKKSQIPCQIIRVMLIISMIRKYNKFDKNIVNLFMNGSWKNSINHKVRKLHYFLKNIFYEEDQLLSPDEIRHNIYKNYEIFELWETIEIFPDNWTCNIIFNRHSCPDSRNESYKIQITNINELIEHIEGTLPKITFNIMVYENRPHETIIIRF